MGIGVSCKPAWPTALANMEVWRSVLCHKVVASGTVSPLGCWWRHHLMMMLPRLQMLLCIIQRSTISRSSDKSRLHRNDNSLTVCIPLIGFPAITICGSWLFLPPCDSRCLILGVGGGQHVHLNHAGCCRQEKHCRRS